MSKFKFAPDLFLELQELNYLQESLDEAGFRKNIRENSVNFGLVKNSYTDPNFTNGYVSQDADDLSGNKCVKIQPIKGIDSNGQFLYSENIINQISLVNDGSWYWLKIKHQLSVQEKGTVSIAVNGDLIGSGTEFTKYLRGESNFPASIKLLNSALNTLVYQVLAIIDNENAILSNPATNIGGLAEFSPESNLTYGVVGTFTPGVAVPAGSMYPFQHDSLVYELIQETTLNTPPTFVPDQEFYLARIKNDSGTVTIQDKREDIYETKGSQLPLTITRTPNPLIGVEAIKWQVPTNPADKSIVEVAWGMRSSNWSINSSLNILTLISALGGKYKTVADFNDGDLDGWRVYTGNGKYSYIVASAKVGGAINLTLDNLDVDNYSTDGGTTMIVQEVRVVPDCDSVEFWAQSDVADATPSVNQYFCFPVNDSIGRLELEVYKTTSVDYGLKYRYKSFKEFTEWQDIPSDTDNGYLTELSFDDKGTQIATIRQTYTVADIVLNPCPWSYSVFQSVAYNNDLLGVNTIPTLGATPTYNLVVGTDKHYQYIGGTQSIASDTTFTLSNAAPCRDGSTFKIHFNCSSLSLGSSVIYIKQGSTTLKQITISDIKTMLDQDGGIIFSCEYDADSGLWRISQNYENPVVGDIKIIDGVIADLFDVTGGLSLAPGRVRGLYGYVLCVGGGTVNGIVVPNLEDRFLLGSGVSISAGSSGGNNDINLTVGQLPAHNHPLDEHGGHHHAISNIKIDGYQGGGSTNGVNLAGSAGAPHSLDTDNATTGITMGNTGTGDDINIKNPYYAILYCKRVF